MTWSNIFHGWAASAPGWAVVIIVAWMNSRKARIEIKTHLETVADKQTETLVTATANLTDEQTRKLAEIVGEDGQPPGSRTT